MPPCTGKVLLTQLDSLKLAGCFACLQKGGKNGFLKGF